MSVVKLPSACPLDCPDLCSLEVTVRDDKIEKIDGTEENPITQGYICGKVRRFADHVYGPERLLRPAVRNGEKGSGDFREVGWDEALSLICQRIREAQQGWGGESILPLAYGGSNGYLTHDTIDARFFYRLGSSHLDRTVCAAPSSRAVSGMYGKMPGVAFDQYPLAKLIVVWGANPSASNIHLVPYIKRARQAGCKLVVVDPRQIPIAGSADLHIAVRPGTDLALALCLINWLFSNGKADLDFLNQHAVEVDQLRERASVWTTARASAACGVAEEQIEQFANLYAESSPAVIRCGWGPERNRNGGSAISAIVALPAVAGKFGVTGGGFTSSNSGAWDLNAASAAAEIPPNTRHINMNLLGRALVDPIDPPIKILFVYNANPLATVPNQQLVRNGLNREDLFTVVFDQVMTDTARYADVLLPATTFLEHEELRRSYGSFLIQESKPVIKPVGESRPNFEVFAQLLDRMELSRPNDPVRPEQLAETILNSSEHGRSIRPDLDEQRMATPACGRHPVQFEDVFPATADGKIHLCPADLDAEAPLGLYEFQREPRSVDYPLALISPASAQTVSSSLAQLVSKPAELSIHPMDAAVRSIADGRTVRVFNELGEVHCTAKITDTVRTGVVELPKGLWSKHTENGNTANSLAPDSLSDLGGGACFNDARVEVEALAVHSSNS